MKKKIRIPIIPIILVIIAIIIVVVVINKNSKTSSYVTVSIGIYSDYANNILNIDDVYKKADNLLYEAKELGKNKVVGN